jgi:hypothetical protein
MGLSGRSIARRVISALVAAGLAFGLLHGPSMMLPAAAAQAGTDCHGALAKPPAAHAYMHNHDDISLPGMDEPLPSPDDGQPAALSNCPLANIASIAGPELVVAIGLRPTQLSAHEARALVSTILDQPDPPPRPAA